MTRRIFVCVEKPAGAKVEGVFFANNYAHGSVITQFDFDNWLKDDEDE